MPGTLSPEIGLDLQYLHGYNNLIMLDLLKHEPIAEQCKECSTDVNSNGFKTPVHVRSCGITLTNVAVVTLVIWGI
jgi:hypothetical protein